MAGFIWESDVGEQVRPLDPTDNFYGQEGMVIPFIEGDDNPCDCDYLVYFPEADQGALRAGFDDFDAHCGLYYSNELEFIHERV